MLFTPVNSKFFISCVEGRVGTTMLVSMLDKHSQIRCLGEIYNPHHPQLFDGEKAPESMEFLKEKVYTKPVSGFKLIAYQMDAIGEEFREEVVASSRVVFMTRKNTLDRFLSMQFARKYSYHGKYGDDPVKIDRVVLEKYFAKCPINEEKRLAYFREKSKGVLISVYEDLLADKKKAMQEIFDFLCVPYEELEAGTEQQRKKTQAEMVSNYDELKGYFSNTPWIEFFTS